MTQKRNPLQSLPTLSAACNQLRSIFSTQYAWFRGIIKRFSIVIGHFIQLFARYEPISYISGVQAAVGLCRNILCDVISIGKSIEFNECLLAGKLETA